MFDKHLNFNSPHLLLFVLPREAWVLLSPVAPGEIKVAAPALPRKR